jgi:hypothetical protein
MTVHLMRRGAKVMKLVRPIGVVVAVVLLAVLAACTGGPLGAGQAPGPFRAGTFAVLDDFEVGSPWSVDSATNHGLLESVGQMFTSGERALKVTAFKMGRLKTIIRKEVDYDFSQVTRLKIDVFNAASEPVDFALAFNTADGGRRFETVPFTLRPGANDGIVFPLTAKNFRPLDGRETFANWQRGRGQVTRLMLVFYEGQQFRSEFFVDNLQCDRPFQTVDRGLRPRMINVLPSAPVVGLFERLEIAVDFEGAFTDPFDHDDVAVWADIRTPSGKHEHIEGFLGDYDRARDKYLWKIRYAPRELGEHTYDVFARTRKGDVGSGPFTLRVVESDAPGFVQVSRADPTTFEHTRGLAFYPFGQNICWASDYEYYFGKVQAYGGNWVRIWMCPWNLWLEGPNGPGHYDLDAAKELDRVVELAEQHGIYIQLVFDYFGIVNSDWDRNPYNEKNGGWCTTPEEFWYRDEAKRFYRRRLDYIVARWGASRNIFAWELFNEADLARRASDDDVVAWHDEMAATLKRIDPYEHLVTTSTLSRGALAKLWTLRDIDFTQAHFYTPRVFDAVPDEWSAKRVYNKPYFIAEFGRGSHAHEDQTDPAGVLLSATLWLAATTPAGGNAMPWWWDTHIDPNDLYGRFGAVARFLDGVDRRSRHDEFFVRPIRLAEGSELRMQGISNRTSAFVYVYDPERILQPKLAVNHAAIPQPLVLQLDGMLSGDYRVELWHAEASPLATSGDVADTFTARCADGSLSITLPTSDEPLAVKVVREGQSGPQMDVYPQGK